MAVNPNNISDALSGRELNDAIRRELTALQLAIAALDPNQPPEGTIDVPISVRNYNAVLDGVTNDSSALSTFLTQTFGNLGLIPNATLLATGFAKTMNSGDDYRVIGYGRKSIINFNQSVGTGTGSAVIDMVADTTVDFGELNLQRGGRIFSVDAFSDTGTPPRQVVMKVWRSRVLDSGALVWGTLGTALDTSDDPADAVRFDLQNLELDNVNRPVFLGNTDYLAWFDCYASNIRANQFNRFGLAAGTTNALAFAQSSRLIYRDLWLDDLELTTGTNNAHIWTHGKECVFDGIFLRGVSGSATALGQSDKETFYGKIAVAFIRSLFIEDGPGDQGMMALKGETRDNIGLDQVGHDYFVDGFHIKATGDVTLTDITRAIWIQASDTTVRNGVIDGMNNRDIRVHTGTTGDGLNNIFVENVKIRRNSQAVADEQVSVRSQGHNFRLRNLVFEEQVASSILYHIALVAGTTMGMTTCEVRDCLFRPRYLSPAGTEVVTSAILLRTEGAGSFLKRVRIGGNRHSVAQTNGIQFTGSAGDIDDVVIDGEDFTDLADPTTAIVNSRTGGSTLTNVFARNCKGIVLQNSGTATIPNGSTSIAVSHGLTQLSGFTMTLTNADLIVVYPIEDIGTGGHWRVTPGTSATQFTIHLDADPGVDVDFNWYVRKEKLA